MSEKKSESKPAINTLHSKSTLGVEGKYNWKRALLVALPLVLVGAYLVLRSFAASGPPTLRVVGDHFVNETGATVQLRGVNRPGIEYTCSEKQNGFIQDPWSAGVSSSPHVGNTVAYGDIVASSMLNWDDTTKSGHAINAVRLPLNEACWLGINGVPAAYGGANYQAFVKRVVDKLTAQGMYVILDDHWPAARDVLPGAPNNPRQAFALTEDHSIPFWDQVSAMFNASNGYPNVMYDLITEPYVQCSVASGTGSMMTSPNHEVCDWKLYKDGGPYTINTSDLPTYAGHTGPTVIAGTQKITDRIRTISGATNPIAVSTIGYGNGDLDTMAAGLPSDTHNPLGPAIVASFHSYSNLSGYNFGDKASADRTIAELTTNNDVNWQKVPGVIGRFPLYIGEIGTDGGCHNPDTQQTFSLNYMNNLGISWTAWGWDSGEGGAPGQCGGPVLVGPPVSTANETGHNDAASSPEGVATEAVLRATQGLLVANNTPPPPPPTDTTPPTISLTAPANGATVTGSAVSLTATAADNVGVTRVDFKVDGAMVNSDTTSPYSFSWNSTLVANGSHSVTGIAYDAAGNSKVATVVITSTNTVVPTDTTPPTISLTAPANGATVTGSSVNLAAAAADNVAVTRVDFKLDGTSITNDTTSPFGTSWDSRNAGNGSHTLSATAYDAAGNSAVSNSTVTVSNIVTTTPPGIPTNLKATASSYNRVNLSWTASTGTVTKYLILRNGSSIDWTNGPVTTYTDNTVAASTQYSYSILAYNDFGNSSGSTEATVATPASGDNTPPTAPSGVTATATSATRVNVSWTASTDNVGVTGYYVVRGGTTIAQLGAVTSYADTTVTASASYSYRIIAFDAKANNSALSSAATVTTPAAPDTTPPSAPANVTATTVGTSQINLAWSASTDAGGSGLKGYDVYRNGVKVTTTPIVGTSYGNTGLSPDTSYDYYVKAVDGANNISVSSSIVTAKTLAVVVKDITPPVWPNGSKLTLNSVTYNYFLGACGASTGCAQKLTWSAATDETALDRYNVLRKVDNGTYTLIGVLSANQLSFNDKTVSDGHTYTYQIFAKDVAGNRTAGPKATKTISCYIVFCQ